MKRLMLGDPHFGKRDQTFTLKQFAFYDEIIFPFIKKNQIKEVIFPGDIFDHRNTTSNWILTEVKARVFDKLATMCKVKVLMGNHDKYYKDKNTHSPLFLYESENIEIISKTTSIDNMLFVPHGCDIEYNGEEYAIGHWDIIGGLMNSNVESTHGLDIADFSQFKQCYSGHYHSQSDIGNVKYIGSSQQLSLETFGMTPKFYIFDNETGELESFDNNFSPRFIRVNYGIETESRDFNIRVDGLFDKSVYYPTESKALKVIEGHYVEIIIRSIPSKSKYVKFKDGIENVISEVNLEIIKDRINSDMDETKIKDIGSFLGEYFDTVEGIPNTWNDKELLELFLQYYLDFEDQEFKGSSAYKSIHFDWLEFTNFGSYRDKVRIEFQNGCYRLIGANGVGKSTISEALGYLLTGKSIFGRSVTTLVNTIENKNMLVSGQLTIGNDVLKLNRGRKKDVFDIIVNGVLEPHLPDSREYQEILNRSIGLSIDHIKYLILKNKENYIPFSELKPDAKRNFIDVLFNFEIFSRILESIKADLKAQNKFLIEQDSDIKVLTSKVELKKEHIEELRVAKTSALKSQIEQLSNYKESVIIVNLENQISDKNIEISDESEKIKANEVRSSSIAILNDDTKQFINSIHNSINEKNNEVLLLKKSFKTKDQIEQEAKKLSDTEKTKLESVFNDEKRKIENQIEQLKLIISGYEKEIVEKKENEKEKLKSIQEQIDNLPTEKILYQEQIELMKSNLDKIYKIENDYIDTVDKKKELLRQIANLNVKIESFNTDKTDQEIKIKKMVNLCGDCPTIVSLKKEMESTDYESKIESIKSEISIIDDNVNELNLIIAKQKTKLDKKSEVERILSENIKNLDSIESRKSQLMQDIELIKSNYNSVISNLNSNIETAKSKIESNNDRGVQLESSFKSEIENLKIRIDSYIQKSIDKVEMNNIKIANIESSIVDDKSKIENKQLDVNKELKAIESRYNDEMQRINDNKTLLLGKLFALKSELDKQTKIEAERVLKNNKLLEEARKSLAIIEAEFEHNIEIENLEKELAHLHSIYDQTYKQITGVNFLKETLINKSGIKQFIIGEYINFFNKLFNDELQKFSVPFVGIFDNNFDIEVLGGIYNKLNYSCLSSGERKMIDVSFMFAISKLQEILFQKTINFVIYDEILSGLSQHNKSIVFGDLVRDGENKTILFIEHDDVEIEGLSAIWEITNKNGSKINFDYDQ